MPNKHEDWSRMRKGKNRVKPQLINESRHDKLLKYAAFIQAKNVLSRISFTKKNPSKGFD